MRAWVEMWILLMDIFLRAAIRTSCEDLLRWWRWLLEDGVSVVVLMLVTLRIGRECMYAVPRSVNSCMKEKFVLKFIGEEDKELCYCWSNGSVDACTFHLRMSLKAIKGRHCLRSEPVALPRSEAKN